MPDSGNKNHIKQHCNISYDTSYRSIPKIPIGSSVSDLPRLESVRDCRQIENKLVKCAIRYHEDSVVCSSLLQNYYDCAYLEKK